MKEFQAVHSSRFAASRVGRGFTKWGVAFAVSLGALMEIVDATIINVALPQLQASLGATLQQISWVVSSYAIANVIILPLSAWLGERFGRKRYFVFSLIGFTLSSVLCGLSQSLTMLIVSRVLQGLTGGGLLAKAQSILFETFPKEEQAKAQAVFGAVVIAGPTIGPTLGGYLVTNVDWRFIFFVNIPVGVLAFVASNFFLPEDGPSERIGSVDWGAIAFLAVGLGSLQAFLEEGNADDWFESNFITTLAITTVLGLVAFVTKTLASPYPVVNLRVLKYRSLWAGSLLSIVVGISLYGALFSVPVFAQTILSFTSEQTGYLLLPGALASAVMMPVAGRFIRRIDARVMLAIGSLIVVLALRMLGTLSPTSGADSLFWPLIVRAVGTTMLFMPLNLGTLSPIPKRDIAAATGFFNLTRQLGGSIGVALLTTLLDRRVVFHSSAVGEKLVATAPMVLSRIEQLSQGLMAKGAPEVLARSQALGIISGQVKTQALVLSFNDTFIATSALIVVSLPLILLLGNSGKSRAGAATH
jgi:DHA2 family multidrug resistance protein